MMSTNNQENLLFSIKKIIPTEVKRSLKIKSRYIGDILTGKAQIMVDFIPMKEMDKYQFQPQISISQVIKTTSHSENKKHNLALAINRLENIVIPSGKLFSFWHLVGNPNYKNGYKEGRTIINNQLQSDIGGGLCQLSGLIYWLILKAGLVPTERHPHTHDIYTELTRFAPLGSDATVVYGYKDLRFINSLPVPICWQFQLLPTEIIASLCSTQKINQFEIEFRREEGSNEQRIVHTVRLAQGKEEIIDTSYYLIMNN
ncbi:MAG TPA: VanW family protein [Oculatellaceae cyanobacterium]|jgi:vancomycin resistance protein VanW